MKEIFILLFFVISCVQVDTDEVLYKIYKHWLYVTDIKTFSNSNEIIERPPGAEVLVLQLNFSEKSQCVYYLVPYKNKLGNLIITENKNTNVCPENNTSKALIEIPEITKLKIQYAQFNLNISFFKNKKEIIIDVPLFNINKGLIHQKFKSKKSRSLLNGLSLAHSGLRMHGELQDRFLNGHALRCHQVNEKCETVGDFRCNECRYGWYEVVDYNCPQGGSKFCGQNHCGEKNEPACPRGYKLFENIETGICQNDLTPVYNGDHILICQ